MIGRTVRVRRLVDGTNRDRRKTGHWRGPHDDRSCHNLLWSVGGTETRSGRWDGGNNNAEVLGKILIGAVGWHAFRCENDLFDWRFECLCRILNELLGSAARSSVGGNADGDWLFHNDGCGGNDLLDTNHRTVDNSMDVLENGSGSWPGHDRWGNVGYSSFR